MTADNNGNIVSLGGNEIHNIKPFIFAAAADLHFREQDLSVRRRAWEYMLDTCTERTIDLVVICGDVFDHHNIHGRTCSMGTVFNAFFEPLDAWLGNDADRRCIIVRGNHDIATAGQDDCLVGLDRRAGIYVSRKTERLSLTPRIDLLTLPWQGEIRKADELEKFTILAGHASVAGALMNRTQRSVGGEFTVSLEDLKGTGADLVLLGDYHRRQELFMSDEGPAGCYIGGFVQKDFGEGSYLDAVDERDGTAEALGDTHGGNPDGFAIIQVPESHVATVDFVPIPFAPKFMSFNNDGWEYAKEELDTTDKHVRIIGPTPPEDIPDGVKYEYRPDPNETRERRAVSEEFNLEQSPGELLAAWIEANKNTNGDVEAAITGADLTHTKGLLAQILAKQDITISEPAGEGLKAIRRIVLENIGPHKRTVWEPEKEGLTALVGRIGAGKTYILEALPAVAWGEYPFRKGGLSNRLTWGGESKGLIEVEIETSLGNIYGFVRTVKRSGSDICYIYKFNSNDDEGSHVAGPKSADVAAKATEILGSKKVFLGSIFATQKQVMNLFQLGPAERKEFFAELLGTDDLLLIGKAAKTEKERIAAEIQRDTATMEVRQDEAAGAEAIRKNLAVHNELHEALVTEQAEKAKVLEVSQAEVARAEEADGIQERINRSTKTLEMNRESRERVSTQKAELEKSVAGKEDLEAAAAIGRAAAEKQKDLDQLAILEEKEERLLGEQKDFAIQLGTVGKDIEDLRIAVGSAGDLESLIDAGRSALKSLGEIAKAKANKDGLLRQLESEEQWAAKLFSSQNTVEEFETHDVCSTCPLYLEASTAKSELDEKQELINKLKSQIDSIKLPTSEAVQALKEEDRKGAEARQALGRIEAQTESLGEKLKEKELVEEKIKVVRDEIVEVQSQISMIKSNLGDWTHELAESRIQEGQEAERKLAVIEKSDDLLEEYTRQLHGLNLDIDTLEKSIKAANETLAGLPDLYVVRTRLRNAEEALDKVNKQIPGILRRIGELEAGLKKAEEATAEVDELRLKIADAGDDLRAYTLLELAFSRDGIPQYLVDVAMPDLEAICADILEALGGRFTIKIKTQDEVGQGSKKKLVEDLIFEVTNSKGHTADVGEFSGGEQTLLAQVVRVAVAAWLSRRSGCRNQVFGADEPFDGLDEDTAIDMLDLLQGDSLGLEQVLLVSHSSYLLSTVENRALLAKKNDAPVWESEREAGIQGAYYAEEEKGELFAEVGAGEES